MLSGNKQLKTLAVISSILTISKSDKCFKNQTPFQTFRFAADNEWDWFSVQKEQKYQDRLNYEVLSIVEGDCRNENGTPLPSSKGEHSFYPVNHTRHLSGGLHLENIPASQPQATVVHTIQVGTPEGGRPGPAQFSSHSGGGGGCCSDSKFQVLWD